MQIVKYPNRDTDWQKLIVRPSSRIDGKIEQTVREIIFAVKNSGDKALYELTEKFDQIRIESICVDLKTAKQVSNNFSQELKDAIAVAYQNIKKFHESQLSNFENSKNIETTQGINCFRRTVPIERVGIYIPSGTAPLFSTALMLGIPAKIAGCKEIVLVSPPPIDPTILFVAEMAGITEVYQVGGAQAIAALAFGTESIKPVSKIFGPGNLYVTVAKQLIAQLTNTAIDMPAGPSELLIIADNGADPKVIAADLLSQAEHGIDSDVVLVTDTEDYIEAVIAAVNEQLLELPRSKIAAKAMDNCRIVLVSNLQEAIDFSNYYAPEHLILAVKNPLDFVSQIINAGSVFLGYNTPESFGDYASGTNHTLPTGGAAKAYSGVSVDSFMKQITFQSATIEGLNNLSSTVEIMAKAEGLDAHARAVSIRLAGVHNE